MNPILLLPALVALPWMGLLVNRLLSPLRETGLYRAAQWSVLLNLIMVLIVGGLWALNGYAPIAWDGPVLYHSSDGAFRLSLFMDGYGFVYLLTSTAIMSLAIWFSRTYMHRDPGFKRFFSNIQFFYIGITTLLASGNLEVLFIGWEIIGVTSFFLIGFYRERYLPVKNALKVVSLYRVADIALLSGIWMCHHHFGHSLKFIDFSNFHDGFEVPSTPGIWMYFIPLSFLLAAMVKSGQFPFSSWVPRAMEGPTTSSAIFYGAVSIHIGVFLLIRTEPLWGTLTAMHVTIGIVGGITSLVATLVARVQPSVKTQIGYASIAQIGLMFIWVALDWHVLAMIHFATNACLRAYQLLVSPSILSYLIHNLFFHFQPRKPWKQDGAWTRIRSTIYLLGLREFHMDNFLYFWLWSPLKMAGNALRFIDVRKTYAIALPVFFMGLYGVYHVDKIPLGIRYFLPETFAVIGLVFILKAFVERESALHAWVLVIINQLFQSLTFGYNESFDYQQVHIFLSGLVISALVGIYIINMLQQKDEDTSLHTFHGHSFDHSSMGFGFALACLGLAGFPITPTFIGEDLMLGHIHENQLTLLALIVLNLVLDGLVIFRIYARLFLGPYQKNTHVVSYRAS